MTVTMTMTVTMSDAAGRILEIWSPPGWAEI